MRKLNFKHGIVYLLFVLAVGVIIMAALARDDSDISGAQTAGASRTEAQTLTPLQCGLSLAIIVGTVIGVVVITRTLGPIIHFIPQKATKAQLSGHKPNSLQKRFARIGIVYLFFVLAVGVIIMAALRRAANEPVPETFEEDCCESQPISFPFWVMLIFPVIGVLGSGTALLVTWREYVPNNRMPESLPSEPVADDAPDPDYIQPVRREIEGLGFTLIERRQPVQPALPMACPNWAFINSDQRVAAVVTAAEWSTNIAMLYTTYYSDGAILETRYPIGMKIDTPMYRAIVHSGGIQLAYKRHQEELEKLRAHHGEPVLLNSVDAFRKQRQQFNVSHLPILQQKLNRQAYGPPLGTLVISVGLLAVTLLTSLPSAVGQVACYLLPVALITALWSIILANGTLGTAKRLKAAA